MIVQAILLGLIAFIGKCDLATGTNMIQRPIVLGPLVGLVLGDLSAGITIGATLELFFLGSISVGAYIPRTSLWAACWVPPSPSAQDRALRPPSPWPCPSP